MPVAPAVLGHALFQQPHMPVFNQPAWVEEQIIRIQRAQAAAAFTPIAQAAQCGFQMHIVAEQRPAQLHAIAGVFDAFGMWCQCVKRRGAEQPCQAAAGRMDAIGIARQQILQQHISLRIVQPRRRCGPGPAHQRGLPIAA
ncbi:hypothetical protein D3C81_1223530 [compost metagenome]